MRRNWTADEIKLLARAYFHVLRCEHNGEAVNKRQTLRDVQAALPHRTLHTLMDRCYRISEVLNDHGLPWVYGWKPPAMVGQTPNSPGVSKLIWEVVEPMLARELPGAVAVPTGLSLGGPSPARKRPVVPFTLVNEGAEPWAETFLEGFLPTACQELIRYLGDSPEEVVPIVLSSTRQHESRFPPRVHEIRALDDPFEPPFDNERQGMAQAWSSYAHGVCTVADARQKPPAGVTLGGTAIYLDVETIEGLAGKHLVSPEATLGRVALHELAHAFRGHPTEAGRATHGWLKEGDAQRDAWHVLTELLGNEHWRLVAWSGRAAQVRQASTQPAAYDRFPATSEERSHLAHADAPAPEAWILVPPRSVVNLLQQDAVEVPTMHMRIGGNPRPGDEVFLGDREVVAGPWVVLSVTPQSRLDHPVDHQAVERKCKEERTTRIEWLQLRLLSSRKAGISNRRLVTAMYPWRLKPEEDAELRAEVTSRPEVLAQAIGEQRRADLIVSYEELGHPVPNWLLDEDGYDPFDDRNAA